MCEITRRGFMMGCSAAIASLAGPRWGSLAFGDPGQNSEVLVVIFLRGGTDGLSVVPPIAGSDRGHYESARPTLQIPTSGPNAAIDLNGAFGLHPAAAPLFDLYQDGKLSIVQAVGMDIVNRSHFDAMQFVELGTPGDKLTDTGWLSRHLASAHNLPDEMIISSLAMGDLQPSSLLGSLETLNMASPSGFNISTGPWLWRHPQRAALRSLYNAADTWLHETGISALDALDVIELYVSDEYVPENGAVYPDSSLGDHLQVLAQITKLDLGLQIATLDVGGWDTHEEQGDDGGGYFATLIGDLAQGLAAFYTDLNGAGANDYTQRLTVVVQSEFGRELAENSDSGTEHGYGNNIYVLSGNAIGGIHGAWPGLAPGQLVDGTDVAVTTDFRQVLSEILIRRMCNPQIGLVFPGYSGYQPLGIVSGADLPPVYAGEIFSDGFESGDLSNWTPSI
jgi:uncharacterized protein (DUF1501 family)